MPKRKRDRGRRKYGQKSADSSDVEMSDSKEPTAKEDAFVSFIRQSGIPEEKVQDTFKRLTDGEYMSVDDLRNLCGWERLLPAARVAKLTASLLPNSDCDQQQHEKWDAAQEVEFQIQTWDDMLELVTTGVAGSLPVQLLALSLLYLKPTLEQLNDQERKDMVQLCTQFPEIKWTIPYRRAPPGEQHDQNAMAHFKLLAKSYATWIIPREEAPLSTKWKLHDLIDCRDPSGRWSIARVDGVLADKVKVRYEGWDSRWNEWINIDSDRLEPFGTHVRKWTGASQTEPPPEIARLLQWSEDKSSGPKTDIGRFHSEHQANVMDIMAKFSHVLVVATPACFRIARKFAATELEAAFPLSFWHRNGRSEIYCSSMFALRPADFQVALHGMYKRYLLELPKLSAWDKRKVETEKNRALVRKLLNLDGPIRDETELTVTPQQIVSKEWACDLYARWIADGSDHKGLDTTEKSYGLFLVDIDPKSVGSNVGMPYFDSVSHIHVFPTTSLAQLATLISAQHEHMQSVTQKNRLMYKTLEDLTCTFSKKLGDGQNIVSYRQLVWYEQNPFVNQIIEVYQALIHNADRIKECIKFVSPAFILSASASASASASESDSKASSEGYQAPRVNAHVFVVPPSSQKIHLETSSCLLRIPATFTTASFDLEKFVAAIGGLIPNIVIPRPVAEPSKTSNTSTPVPCFAKVTTGISAD